MKEFIPDLNSGDFAENITTKGVVLNCLKIGDRIIINRGIILEVTQIGKKCHTGCEIQKLTGECIMPRKGVFTRVIKGRFIEKDDKLRIQKPSR